MQARHTELSVSFGGVDISDTVSKYLLSLSYTDNEEDEADDLQLKLEDRDGVWLQKWLNDTIQTAAETSESGADTMIIHDANPSAHWVVEKGKGSYDSLICHIYLQALGYYNGAIEQKTTAEMVKAIKAYQKKNKLSQTGKCDTNTWKKLANDVNGMTVPKYVITYKASKNMTIRQAANNTSKKLGVLSNGESCIILNHQSTPWFEVDVNGLIGYVSYGLRFVSCVKSVPSADGNSKTKGLDIRAAITAVNTDGSQKSVDCGRFVLDSIKAQGPPSTVTIKATSLAYSGIRKTERDKSWENYTLKNIAEEIANRAGLGVLYECSINPKYERVEQAQQTDMALLKKLCQDCGYSLKISDNQIVIFEQAKYESMEESAKITFGDGSYTKWSIGTGDGEAEYATCRVRYTDPTTGKVISGEAHTEDYDPKDEKNETLVITNQKVSSAAEATELAQKLLKLHNKLEREATITLRGDPLLAAGMTVRLYDFGYWSGKYLVKKAKHDVSRNGYTTAITLRKVDEVETPPDVIKKTYKVGDEVKFKGGKHYAKANDGKPTGGKRKAGKAKITKINDVAAHPYRLQGGYYNSLSGNCNVNGWVDEGTFE